MSGIWSELILYAIATPIWLDTPPDTLVHDGAHFVMMMTGLMSLIVNWNPLMKLDRLLYALRGRRHPGHQEDSTGVRFPVG